MITLHGPVLSLVLEKDGRRLILFGDYHEDLRHDCGNSIKINEFLKRNFHREMTFYVEAYRDPGAVYNEMQPQCPLDAVCAAALKGETYPAVKFVLNDVRFERLPNYSELHDAFNFPEDFPNSSERSRRIVELYTKTATQLSRVKKDSAFYRDFLKLTPNRNLFFKVVYEMTATARNLATAKLKGVNLDELERNWFFQMLIINDLFTIQDLSQFISKLSLLYMGYYHVINIAHRLIDDQGYRLVWSSSSPVASPPDVRGKSCERQIDELRAAFRVDVDSNLRQCIPFDERFLESRSEKTVNREGVLKQLWSRLRPLVFKYS